MKNAMKIIQSNTSKIMKRLPLLLLAAVFLFPNISYSNTNEIQAISYSTLPGSRLQINIQLKDIAEKPLSFTIDNPARLAFDFPKTISKLSKKKTKHRYWHRSIYHNSYSKG